MTTLKQTKHYNAGNTQFQEWFKATAREWLQQKKINFALAGKETIINIFILELLEDLENGN